MDQQTPNQPQEENVLSSYYEGVQQLQLESAEAQVRKARNALFIVAGLTLVVNLFTLSRANSLSGFPLILVIIMTATFAGLALLTKKQPFTAIVIGLIVYGGLWILDIIVLGPEYLLRGIILKGIIIYILASTLKHAREAERIKKEMSALL